jgi:hypothetical protein
MTGAWGAWGIDLESAAHLAGVLPMVRKSELRTGDILIVRTCNSVYTMRSLDTCTFMIRGGWFDRVGEGPCTTSIKGCTWGGSMIKADVVAACGMCIEFGNRITTSLVRSIVVIPSGVLN